MSIRKFDEIVPDAMQAINRMIEKARSGDRGAIRVKRKRARQLELTLNK